MAWQAISDFAIRMRPAVASVPPLPLREQAAVLALQVYGSTTVAHAPALINIAALTILMQPRLVVHRVSAGAVRLVHETDLHTLPGEPPRLLRGPWIVEARQPGREVLFGATAALGGYPIDGAIYLVGVDWPEGVAVARWTPRWEERDLLAEMPARDDSPLIDDVDRHHDWAREAARFALVLGLHLDATGTPITVMDERPARQQDRRRAGNPGTSTPGEWVVRRVYLGRISPSPARRPADAPGPGGSSGTEGRMPTTVTVRGHLRRQPYGPGRSERRWIFVESYEARRWVAPRPLRLDIRADPHEGT